MQGASPADRGGQDLPCFASGTLITTPRGEVAIEALRPGDRLLTRDGGLQELRDVHRHRPDGRSLVHTPERRPVMIRAGAFGRALPERDLCVGAGQGIFIGGDLAKDLVYRRIALVAARRLLTLDGVHQVDAIQTEFHTLHFDTHELVIANGVWCESAAPATPRFSGWGDESGRTFLPRFD